jgi:hypothetical protein
MMRLASATISRRWCLMALEASKPFPRLKREARWVGVVAPKMWVGSWAVLALSMVLMMRLRGLGGDISVCI